MHILYLLQESELNDFFFFLFLLFQLPLAKLQEDVLTKLQKVVIFALPVFNFLNSCGLNGILFNDLVQLWASSHSSSLTLSEFFEVSNCNFIISVTVIVIIIVFVAVIYLYSSSSSLLLVICLI